MFFNGDDKLFKQSEKQLQNHDFQKATALLEKVSSEGKSGVRYLQLAALTSDSLLEYGKAILYYEMLQKQESGNINYGERINWLKAEKIKTDEAERIRLEKMKNCLKCKGTGYYEVTGTCSACNGFRKVTKDCSTCHGKGVLRCNNCDGLGYTQSRSGDKNSVSVSCGKCGGRGTVYCNALCNNGKVTEDCRKCNGTGQVTEKVKCDLH
jgi:DnaJ-class molecular chaperone